MQIRLTILWIILSMSFVFGGCHKEQEEMILLEDALLEEDVETDADKDTIFVYVCGAVVQEGVYELPAGSRSYEAIAMAGGFTEIAARTEIDQAALLTDEMTLYVPNYSEAVKYQEEEDGKININTASKEELMTLPGVGESKASSIISYREEHGGFKAIEDIMLITGIKEGLFQKVKDYISI